MKSSDGTWHIRFRRRWWFDFELLNERQIPVARFIQPKWYWKRFRLEVGNRSYEVRKRSFFRLPYLLIHREETVGRIHMGNRNRQSFELQSRKGGMHHYRLERQKQKGQGYVLLDEEDTKLAAIQLQYNWKHFQNEAVMKLIQTPLENDDLIMAVTSAAIVIQQNTVV